MQEQIRIVDVREVLKQTKIVAPILNRNEYVTLMLFYQQVLERYASEEYPEGFPEEEEE